MIACRSPPGEEGLPADHTEPAHRESDLYLTPPLRREPLKIGLLLDATVVPAWIARIVAQIQACGFAKTEFAVINVGTDADCVPRVRPGRLLYAAYVRREVAKRRRVHSPFETRDLSSLLKGVRLLHVDVGSQQRPTTESDEISPRADVLLRFGFCDVDPSRFFCLGEEIWTHHHGDSDQYTGAPPLFWEIQEHNPVSGTELQRITPDGTVEVLFRSYGSTHPHSLELSREAAYWKASSFVMRGLRELARGGRIAPLKQSGHALVRDVPGNARMLQFLAGNVSHKARALVRNRTTVEHWSILWRTHAPQLDPASPSFEGARELACPHGHFYADPFLFRHHGEDWLFVEDYCYAERKADIAAIPWSGEGPAAPARTVLRLPEHLSYPHVFAWNGEVYMVPEIGDVGGPVSLFRARRFPDDWQWVCDLLTGHRAVDATLHEHGGRWYLFVNICEAGGSENDELFLFHADTPLGPFKPHPRNPVVSDVRRARPAGRMFSRAGKLIRPGQDCAGGYGRAVVFNEVLTLDPESYEEKPIGRLAPAAGGPRWGYHTYAALEGLEVVDLKRPRWRRQIGA